MKKDFLVFILKKLVILPNQEIKIDLVSKISKNIIDYANSNYNGLILVVAPINQKEETPSFDDLPSIGVIANIKSKIVLPNGNYRIVLKGLYRVSVDKYLYFNKNNEILFSNTTIVELPKFNQTEEEAIKRKLKSTIKKYVSMSNTLSNSVINNINGTHDISYLTDLITSFLPFDTSKKLEYMQTINPLIRGKNLIADIEEEIEIIKIEETIDDKVKNKLNENERRFILEEKLKEIQNELGHFSLKDDDVKKYFEILDSLKINEKTKKKLFEEINKYKFANIESPETNVIRNYLETVLYLPWNISSKETKDMDKIKKHLDKTHYGLNDIKDRVVEYIGLKNINKDIVSPIICLVGPPGVGKTTIAMSIAESLNREFIKISVGGLNDSTELNGSRRTYLGANPGKIIQGIKKCQANNPLILIDEVDKMVKDYKGDPASTLLEILDPNQNNSFVDNYVEEEFDLSKIFFILTANNVEDIPLALLDRLEIIELNSYTFYEKIDITKNYLIEKICKMYGIENIKLNNELIKYIVNNYTKEAGVRELDRVLNKLIRKSIVYKKELTKNNLEALLGKSKFPDQEQYDKNLVGVCNALAYTYYGAAVTIVEAIKFKGTGKFTMTGSLGKVMEESILVAQDYIKSNYKTDLKNFDIHIHFLDGASKKDGPSGGISIISAILSLFLNKKIDNKIAFTGEISLNGNILPVGKVKEKIIGAINSGIKTIYVPYDNHRDYEDIPKSYLKGITIKEVKNYKEIYEDLFK